MFKFIEATRSKGYPIFTIGDKGQLVAIPADASETLGLAFGFAPRRRIADELLLARNELELNRPDVTRANGWSICAFVFHMSDGFWVFLLAVQDQSEFIGPLPEIDLSFLNHEREHIEELQEMMQFEATLLAQAGSL